MLVLRKIDNVKTAESVAVTRKIQGEEVTFDLRPWTTKAEEMINSRHTKTEWVKDPDTRQMVKAKNVDREAFFDDMIDYVIEGFSGVGEENGEPLEVTLENKKRLVFLPVRDGEQPVLEWLRETARNLAIVSEEEIEEQRKNSRKPYNGSTAKGDSITASNAKHGPSN